MQSKSALWSSKINSFIDLWCLVASGGLYILVLLTSFQKNYIGWPQQPRTEKVLKFNMIFHDSTQKNDFSEYKTNLWVFDSMQNSRASVVTRDVILVVTDTKDFDDIWQWYIKIEQNLSQVVTNSKCRMIITCEEERK